VKAVGDKDADKVMAKMRELPINDFMTKNGKLRIVPAEQAFRPLDQGGCPLVSAAAKQ
jgi:branched-chain amino acid transport system substrate-binding protein